MSHQHSVLDPPLRSLLTSLVWGLTRNLGKYTSNIVVAYLDVVTQGHGTLFRLPSLGPWLRCSCRRGIGVKTSFLIGTEQRQISDDRRYRGWTQGSGQVLGCSSELES